MHDKANNYVGAMLTWSIITEKVKMDAEADRLRQMVERMPVNVMMLELENFTITYANETSIQTLKQLEHLLPIKADEIVGQCVDIFHKDPAFQRGILADPKNLPHKAHIKVGDEILDLLVSAVHDKDGNYMAAMLTWSIITEKVKADAESYRLEQMVATMPVNVMMLEIENFTITYANETSIQTLKQLEHLLPIKADELVGQCVDIFYKDPSFQRGILADPKNLPHKAIIQVGEESLDLLVSAVHDKDGNYIAAMLSWSVVTEKVNMANDVAKVVEIVASASTELQSSAQALAATAEETNSQSVAVAAASEEVTTNIQTVASSAEELSSSISEISRQVAESTSISQEAVNETNRTNEAVESLAEAAQKIGDVVKLISDIAGQTNLLALNATIEAARAGEAGKGFAVVASEVKSLANQTARATEDIAAQVSAIQNETAQAVTAIKGIGSTINKVNEIAVAISSAVEEQGAATAEISRNVTEASNGTQEVTTNIANVSTSAGESGQAAGQVLEAASGLSQNAEDMRKKIEDFMNGL